MTDLADLKRQAKEAEALVRQLERGEKATPKQSHSVTLRNSHSGYAGKSLIEQIRDDLRDCLREHDKMPEPADVGYDSGASLLEREYSDGLIDGICHALGVLRQNERQTERKWAEAEYRESVRHEQKEEKTSETET